MTKKIEKPKGNIETKTTMTLKDFVDTIDTLDITGREETLKHKDKYPAPKDRDAKGNLIKQKGSRYHAAGTDSHFFAINFFGLKI